MADGTKDASRRGVDQAIIDILNSEFVELQCEYSFESFENFVAAHGTYIVQLLSA